MENVIAQLSISIECECPHCEEIIDLLEITYLTDDGFIYNECMPDDDTWGSSDFNQEITCPQCEKEFNIEQVEYIQR